MYHKIVELQTLEEQAVDYLDRECFTDDEEINHIRADECLMEFLRKLGYTSLVEKFDSVDKWYA